MLISRFHSSYKKGNFITSKLPLCNIIIHNERFGSIGNGNVLVALVNEACVCKFINYLIKLSAKDMNAMDSHEITKLLHIIGDFERISDHSVNILESAEEMRDKKLEFSNEAKHELKVLSGAIDEIVQLAQGCFTENDLGQAAKVEPLEEVVDYLKDQIKLQHVLRLQKSECSIEHGFVLADILNNMERVADHCSNIAGCVIEISQHDSLSMHSYLSSVRAGGEEFDRVNREYMRKYSLKHAEE